MSLVSFCNTCWMASCYREAHAYERDAARVQATQAKWLFRMLRKQQGCWFGRKHRFATIRSVRDFQNGVPLSNYDDYRPAVERIGNGEPNVLTVEPVRLLEPTGGSTSGEKLIPYTESLRAGFQRAIRVWVWDLYSKRPALRRGRSYWSITPLAHAGRRTSGGIPIGFDDDASYLGRVAQALVGHTMAVPPNIARGTTVADAQYATLYFLLQTGDLSLISVWSPAFLTELLRVLWERWEALCDDIATGRISVSSTLAPGHLLARPQLPAREKAERLARLFRGSNHLSQCIHQLWPALGLVSCWADGPSFAFANQLRRYLPDIEIQPKGLLATEAFVSLPLLSAAAPALAIRSHFFEFQPAVAGNVDSTTRPLLAHELELGERYHVVITNGGGLYRYRLHDEVEVAGFKSDVPLLRFIGKTDDLSDMVGEKLHAAHVNAVLEAASRKLNLSPTFVQLRAEHTQHPPHYRLRIADATLERHPMAREELRTLVEHGLNESPAYRYARDLGQLNPLEIELVSSQQAEGDLSDHLARLARAGRRQGAIKPSTLIQPDR